MVRGPSSQLRQLGACPSHVPPFPPLQVHSVEGHAFILEMLQILRSKPRSRFELEDDTAGQLFPLSVGTVAAAEYAAGSTVAEIQYHLRGGVRMNLGYSAPTPPRFVSFRGVSWNPGEGSSGLGRRRVVAHARWRVDLDERAWCDQ